MSEDDFGRRRRSKKTGIDDDEGEQLPVVEATGGFGVVVFFLAALALGALRRRLIKFNQQANREWYRSEEYGSRPRIVWRVWTVHPSGTQSNAWRFRRTHQFWDEYFEEELRKERIRRMQQAFNQERARYNRGYERWHDQSEGWYSETYGDSAQSSRSTAGTERPEVFKRTGVLRHYEVLGLDPTRKKPYSEAELKAAFRAKAKEHHPDRNPTRRVEAQQKFVEVVQSYEALRESLKQSST